MRERRARTAWRRVLVGVALVGLTVSLGIGSLMRGASPAGAAGLLVGCPDGAGSITGLVGIGINATAQGQTAATPVLLLPGSLIDPAMQGPPEARNLDIDADGLPDLRWGFALIPDPAGTNLPTLWDRIGGTLAPGSSIHLRVTLDRLASDPNLAPWKVSGGLSFTMSTPIDPNDPDGPATTEVQKIQFGYDSRPTSAVVPTKAAFDVVVQDSPTTNPDTGYLGARFATEYRVGGDPAAAFVTPGSEPAVTTLVKVGTDSGGGEEGLDLAVGWNRAPAQLAFVDATTCTGPTPKQTMAWDYRANQASDLGPELAPTDAHVDLVTGKGKGYAGRDEFGLHGWVQNVPEEMTLDLTEETASLRQNQHEVNGSFPESSPKPSILLEQLLIARLPASPGESPTKIVASGLVSELPPITNLAVTTDATTGSFKSADLRFCPGTSWTDPACQADVRAPKSIDVKITDVLPAVTTVDPPLPGESTVLPPLPTTAGPYIAWTERNRGGIASPVHDKHFRFGGRLNGVQHLKLSSPPFFMQQGVQAEVQLAAAGAKTKLFVDTDNRQMTLQGTQVVTTGAAVSVNGDIAPFPSKAIVLFGKGANTPLALIYDFGATKAAITGDVAYTGNTADKHLEIKGKASLGDATGMPTKGSLIYSEQASNLKRIDYNPNGPTKVKVGLTLSNSEDRAKNVRSRLWADGTLGGRVVADWQIHPLDGLQTLDVRPCLTLPCPAGTPIATAMNARLVSGPPIAGETASLLTAPTLPPIDHPTLYPAFTATPRGITYVRLHDGRWGAQVETTELKRFRFEDTKTVAGQKVCVESGKPPADPRFGTRIYLNATGKRTADEPEKPLYVDGILATLPEVIDVRINDEGAAADANKPWLWLHTRSCGATSPPGREARPETGGVEYRVLVKSGNVEAQQLMKSDPLGKAALALGKPGASTPLGATVHALADGTDDVAGFDAAARLTLPSHTVVYRPTIDTCDEGSLITCQDLAPWTRRERLAAKLKVQSTGTSWGAVDALVRIRSFLTVDNAPGPQAPNVCLTDSATGEKKCDLDVRAHIASVPAKFQVDGKLVTNVRTPDVTLALGLTDTSADPNQYPTWNQASVAVTDDAKPAATAVRPWAAGTPVDLYRVDLKNIAHALNATVRFQGTETLPGKDNVCPAHGYAGRGAMDIGYLHADLDLAGATTLTANGRVDVGGRFYANVVSNTPIDGTVRTKVENVAVGEKFEEPQTFSTNDVDLCVDMDIPFEVQLTDTKDARISVDKTTWAMQVPANDPTQKMKFRTGEMNAGTWLAGAVWFKHDVYFNPEGVGEWEWSSTGRRQLGLMQTGTWNGLWSNSFYVPTRWNEIASGQGFTLIPAPFGCCAKDGATYWTMDLFWNQEIRDLMWCRDEDDNCYVAMQGRPGFEFHKTVYLKGYKPRTDAVQFGELANVTPPTNLAGYTFTLDAGMSVPEPEGAEYVAKSQQILQTSDGNRYYLYLGVDSSDAAGYESGDDIEMSTPLSIGADYENGVARWRRELINPWHANCGVVWKCQVTGAMAKLSSGHLGVSWTLKAFEIPDDDEPGQWVTIHSGTKIFDPSGFGGNPSTSLTTVSAQAGQPVSLSSPYTDPDITGLNMRKVWYFGDGSSFEAGEGVLPSVPVSHTYAFAGTYPATLVYYSFDSNHEVWNVKAAIPQQINVSAGP